MLPAVAGYSLADLFVCLQLNALGLWSLGHYQLTSNKLLGLRFGGNALGSAATAIAPGLHLLITSDLFHLPCPQRNGAVTSGPDLSVEVNGLKLPNPFVIGSGPPGAQPPLLLLLLLLLHWLPLPVDGPCYSCCAATAVVIVAATAAAAALLDCAVVSNGAKPASSCHAGTNYAVMKKAFEEGWGGVVAKTVSLDSSKVINVTPRCDALPLTLKSSVYLPVFRPAPVALCCSRRQRAATAAAWLLSRTACGSCRGRSIQRWRCHAIACFQLQQLPTSCIARYAKMKSADGKEVIGWENIELISDR